MLSATVYLAIMLAPAALLSAIGAIVLAIGALRAARQANAADRTVAADLASGEATARIVARFAVPGVDPTDAPAFPSPVAFPVASSEPTIVITLDATIDMRGPSSAADVAALTRAMARAPRSNAAPRYFGPPPVKAAPVLPADPSVWDDSPTYVGPSPLLSLCAK